MERSKAEHLVNSWARLAKDLGEMKHTDERSAWRDTAAVFAQFALSCGFAPAARRLQRLSMSLEDLNYGHAAPVLKPESRGRGLRPDPMEKWWHRVLVLCAMKTLGT